jgi:DNA polymerase III subunit gamma/tau
MGTTSLYQKYRPEDFDQVIGQGVIIDTLRKQIENNQVSHAYLFYGTRGLGKTTTARLMAEALQIAPEDLYEIDAASNRGIDDIRDIRDGVQSRPFSSPYKMYLIDEVHMLTKEAFNALLKTLEEPPAYVIFVLATTELHKVPDTIKSRSQVYTFQRPEAQNLMSLINQVAQKEGVTLADDVVQTIVSRADGSYRDALSHLQIYLTNPEGYTVDTAMMNTVSQLLEDILASEKPASDIMSQVAGLPDPKQTYLQLVDILSNMLFDKVSGEKISTVTSAHLKVALDARSYFNYSDYETVTAGLTLVVANLLALRQ